VNVAATELGLALAVGAVLGWWFFGGLLLTARRLPAARHPVLLAVGSFAVRTAGVLVGMFWLVGRHWLLPVVALVGFVAVRTWLMRASARSRAASPAE
jgi:F1F0 ATPase subunit 2